MLVQDQRGISTIELIPVLLVFALLFNFSLGLFGVVHSGIINSIAARNYAFETFRNRSNLSYIRDTDSPDLKLIYTKDNFRFHGIISEDSKSTSDEWLATKRPLKFTDLKDGLEPVGSSADHNLVRQITDPGKTSDVFHGKSPDDGQSGVAPVWVQTLYGICLTATCTASK